MVPDPLELLEGALAFLVDWLGLAFVPVGAVLTLVVLVYYVHKAAWLAKLAKAWTRYMTVATVAVIGVIVALWWIGVFPTVRLGRLVEVMTP